MRTLLLLTLLLYGPLCAAGKLFECRDAHGRISFQDHGCVGPTSQREIALDEPARARKPADPDSGQIAQWEKASRARLPASLGGSRQAATRDAGHRRRTHATKPDACAVAREAEAVARRERSFRMGFDERRRLSDAVLSACGLH